MVPSDYDIKGLCPRCGAPVEWLGLITQHAKCPHCGWRTGTAEAKSVSTDNERFATRQVIAEQRNTIVGLMP